MSDTRVELQAEVSMAREALFALVSTQAGLATWLDEVEFELKVGSQVRFVLRDAEAVGEVLAIDAPQHVSWSWDWVAESLEAPSAVAFDLIEHGARTHLTMRHVGLRNRAQRDLHDQLWRYWLARLLDVVRLQAAGATTAP
ncbi:MAG: SRPBCC domain-containing protein [Candidatus Limnocylindrales bacterium]